MQPTIKDRARLYNNSEFGQRFPDSRFIMSNRWISATWIMGNNYKSLSKRNENDQPFYGSFPPGWLKRMWTMFPDTANVLHLFSGSLTKEAAASPHGATVIRLDSSPTFNPDVQCDAENFANSVLKKFGPFDLIGADPPYSVEDAAHYLKSLCNKRKVLEQCHLSLRHGGILLWMDQSIPLFSKTNWKWVGVISMYRSTNHRIRGVMMFEKV